MKKFGIAVLIIGILALAAYWYVFHKPHRDIQNEEASIKLSSQQLSEEFVSQPDSAQARYVDQIVEVKGILEEILAAERGLVIRPGIYGSLDSTASLPSLQAGDSIHIRGRVLSFDDLMEEVKLDYVQVLNQ